VSRLVDGQVLMAGGMRRQGSSAAPLARRGPAQARVMDIEQEDECHGDLRRH
jgi:hypothetical protein